MPSHRVAAAARSADKHQRSEVLRAAHISRIKAKALDETRKVEEVTFINTLNNEGKKADLQQRLEEGEWTVLMVITRLSSTIIAVYHM